MTTILILQLFCSLMLVSIVAFVISKLWRAFQTLSLLRSKGVEIFQPGLKTLRDLFSANPKQLFSSLMKDFQKGKKGGLYGWLTPVGKPFVVVTDSQILSQIIVENQSKLVKHHAFGVLEHFRKTDLGSVPAWKVVHRIASKFPVNDSDFQLVMAGQVERFLAGFERLSCNNNDDGACFAEYTRDFYWGLVLVMVLGKDPANESAEAEELRVLYKDAWTACIAALGQPGAHMFSFYMRLPLPGVIKYKILASKLRGTILELIRDKRKPRSSWCILSVIEGEMSEEDQLEVAMEFLFTGASSVTTSLIWLVWHVAMDSSLQRILREEVSKARKGTFEEVPLPNKRCLPEKWITSDSLSDCENLDAALRETLRMYPPIHIGRLSAEDFNVTDANGLVVTIPKGTDIMSNVWFIQRDSKNWENPDTFDHTRFLGKPHNVPFYYPFSMGVRACPGQRIAYNVLKAVAANLLIGYEIEALTGASGACFQGNLMLPVTPKNVILRARRLDCKEVLSVDRNVKVAAVNERNG